MIVCLFFSVAKSALVNYDRDSDDDEHTEDEDEMEENNEEPDAEDNDSNSNHGNTASASGERDPGQNEENPLNEQTIGTSDLLNVTPVRFFLHFSMNIFNSIVDFLVKERRCCFTLISWRYDSK